MHIECYCNAMVSLSSKILIRFTVHVPRSIAKAKNMKVKVYRSKYENFLCSSQKIQKNANRIHLQCSGFIEILDMIISGPTELKTY